MGLVVILNGLFVIEGSMSIKILFVKVILCMKVDKSVIN